MNILFYTAENIEPNEGKNNLGNSDIRLAPAAVRPCDDRSRLYQVNDSAENSSEGQDENQLAYTFCQIPIIYHLCDKKSWFIEINYSNGKTIKIKSNSIDNDYSLEIFKRNDNIKFLKVYLPKHHLLF